jgi:hypothetical protein
VRILIVASFCNKVIVKIVVFRTFNSYLLWDQVLVLFLHSHKNKIYIQLQNRYSNTWAWFLPHVCSDNGTCINSHQESSLELKLENGHKQLNEAWLMAFVYKSSMTPTLILSTHISRLNIYHPTGIMLQLIIFSWGIIQSLIGPFRYLVTIILVWKRIFFFFFFCYNNHPKIVLKEFSTALLEWVCGHMPWNHHTHMHAHVLSFAWIDIYDVLRTYVWVLGPLPQRIKCRPVVYYVIYICNIGSIFHTKQK